MLQFEKNAMQYQKIRNKITYPEALYQNLAAQCRHHQNALDIGCGIGVSTVRLQPYFQCVEGVDIGEKLIQFARQSYPTIHFHLSSAEQFAAEKSYDLITSATAFYWMDRTFILKKMAQCLAADGVFCAYKYDFPIVYGELRNFIDYELATKWAHYRDHRLVNYDDTLEIMQETNLFYDVERFLVSNRIDLTSEEIAHFFLSTSYVTQYIEQARDTDYYHWFLNECLSLEPQKNVKVNFDVEAYIGKRKD